MSDENFGELNPPVRLLLGPGPSNIHPRVYRAMMAPMLGHLDPAFLHIMDETMALLRRVFQTQNQMTLPLSGTGSAGMEAALCNLLEPRDRVIVGISGLFGERMAEMASRCGAEVIPVRAEWGHIIEPDELERAIKSQPAVKAVALVHAETSTGVLQPLEEIAPIVKEHQALLVVDTVTSLGGSPVAVDTWGSDFCYSGTQKCLSCPPGLAPITVSERAIELIHSRKTKVQSWYLDLSLLGNYWSEARVYHHTAPISMVYALREALRIMLEEGLEASVQRHQRNGRALQTGLEAMGLKLHAQEGYRLPMLTSVQIPEGVDDLKVRRALLEDFNIEIGGGLGQLRGRIWRIGLMGYSSNRENVLSVLAALGKVLAKEGYPFDLGAGIAAAIPLL